VKVGYHAGPATDARAAAGTLFAGAELVAEKTFDDVFAALRRRAVDAAVVPVENTESGMIADVYDLLRTHVETRIVAEAIVRDRAASAESHTRFFAITNAGAAHAPRTDGPMKTSLVYATRNVPGALIHSLQPFAVAGIQLTKIESRPSRTAAWEYVFYLDFEGDPASSHVADALEVMRASCEWVHVLGTYPAATRLAAAAA
jgi:prephenate dehydratase